MYPNMPPISNRDFQNDIFENPNQNYNKIQLVYIM